MTRIISGDLKGRWIKSLKSHSIRPTKSRVKESLFAILQDIEGARVVDLFAGTGNLGFEAISRGAEDCIFVDSNRNCIELIKSNANLLGVSDKVDVKNAGALQFLKGNIKADIILADPPYNYQNFPGLFEEFKKLGKGTRVIVESEKNFSHPNNFNPEYCSTRIVGETSINYYMI